jgi:microcystin-dependent protein
MWFGEPSKIPHGWVLCDGLPHTQDAQGRPLATAVTPPNLLNRFPIGAGGTFAKNTPGGVDTFSLTVEHLPSHSHDAKLDVFRQSNEISPPATVSPLFRGGIAVATGPITNTTGDLQAASGPQAEFLKGRLLTVTVSPTPANNANQTAIDNKPPFTAVFFIMKV